MSLNNTPSFIAGGTIHVSYIVKLSTSADNTVVEASAATDNVIGVAKRSAKDVPGLSGSDNSIAARSGESCMIYGIGEVAPVVCGGTITRGSWVTSNGSGKAIAAATTTNLGVLGQAMESGTSGVEIQVLIMPHRAGQF